MSEKEFYQIICPVCGKYEFKEPFEDSPFVIGRTIMFRQNSLIGLDAEISCH